MNTKSGFLLHRRFWLWALGVIAVLALLITVVAPIIARRVIVKEATAVLHRPVLCEAVRINPFTCAVTIRGLQVMELDGKELAGWDELYVNFAVSSFWRGVWSFNEIRITHPRAHAVIKADGAINLVELIPTASPEAKAKPVDSTPGRPLHIQRLQVIEAALSFTDLSLKEPFEKHLIPVSFVIEGLSTKPEESGPGTFAATTDAGERFAWEGKVQLIPFRSSGHLSATEVKLAKYSAYSNPLTSFRVRDGRFDFEANYSVDLSAKVPAFALTKGAVHVRDLKVHSPDGAEPVIAFANFDMEGFSVDGSSHEVNLGQLRLNGLSVVASRLADGGIDLLKWVAPLAAESAKTPVAAAPAASTGKVAAAPTVIPGLTDVTWVLTMPKFQMQKGRVAVTDLSTSRPAKLLLSDIQVSVTDFSSRPGSKLGLDATMRFQEQGQIGAKGGVSLDPIAASIDINVSALDLCAVDPYASAFVNASIAAGQARAQGKIEAKLSKDNVLDLTWTGDCGVSGLSIVDSAKAQPLFSLGDIGIAGMSFTLQPMAVSIGEITIRDPSVRVTRFADKQLNVATLVKAAAPVAAAPATPAPASPAPVALPKIEVAKVVLVNASFSFADQSVHPSFTTRLTGFGGSISGLSSEQLARADVDLSGRIGAASLKVFGKINPLGKNPYSDVKVTCSGLELPAFSPYSGQFVGYTISKGKLVLDLSYKLSQQELVAENKILFDQFFLGQTVESPDAVKLPLKLGLALLRDKDGRIDIDMPIRGNLNDPDFKYGKLVWKTLGNLLVKAAASPFKLLGGLVGGGEDLSQVEYASGSADLDDAARKRLDSLAKALAERPALSLEIQPRLWPTLDDVGLREMRLVSSLRGMKAKDMIQAGAPAADPSHLVLSPEETEKYIRQAFALLPPAKTSPALAVPTSTASSPAASVSVAQTQTEPRTEYRLKRWMKRLFHIGQAKSGASSSVPVAAETGGKVAAPVDASGAPAAITLAEMRSRLLEAQTVDETDLRKLALRRASRIQTYLQTQGKIEPARLFVTDVLPVPDGVNPPVPSISFSLQ